MPAGEDNVILSSILNVIHSSLTQNFTIFFLLYLLVTLFINTSNGARMLPLPQFSLVVSVLLQTEKTQESESNGRLNKLRQLRPLLCIHLPFLALLVVLLPERSMNWKKTGKAKRSNWMHSVSTCWWRKPKFCGMGVQQAHWSGHIDHKRGTGITSRLRHYREGK